MSYFDGITAPMFKKDEEGNELFFPWGIFGYGFVIPTKEKKTQLFKTLKKINIVSLVLAIVLARSGIALLFLLPFLLFGYYIYIQTITRNMIKSNESLKLSEAHKNSAQSFSYTDLILMSLVSLGFVFAGIWIIIEGKGFWIGLASVVFFGACFVSTIYGLVKKSQKENGL